MTAPGPRTARGDLQLLVERSANGIASWTTALGAARPRAGGQRQSAVLVLFGLLEASDVADPAHADVDLLLTRRSDALRHHPGQIAFPGGGLDDGESPAAAAVREAVEETGVEASGLSVIGELPAVPVVVSGNVVTPVLAWWDSPSPLVVDGTETAEAFRVPVAELVHPDNRGVVHYRLPDGRVHVSPAFDVGGHVVWGFTAYVLDALLTELGWASAWDAERVIALPGQPSGSTP